MLMSMTGYCSVNEQLSLSGTGAVYITVEIKTLNGRFFEVVPKISSSLSHLEMPITNYLQERFIRGRVYLNVRFDDRQSAGTRLAVSWPLADQYVEIMKSLQERYNLQVNATALDVLKLPDVIIDQENVLTADDDKAIMSLIAKSVDVVLKMRIEEGTRLLKDFTLLFASCLAKVTQVEHIFNNVINSLKERIRQSIAAHQDTDEVNNEVEELQATMKKVDIHEEIIRFKSHLTSVAPLLQSSNIEKGKRLDFMLQELMRETNTMMAKCPSYEINATCIDIKVDVEKAREQVQNIV